MQSCPNCNGEMVERTAKKSGKKFWGCKDFPRCDGVIWPDRKVNGVEPSEGCPDWPTAPQTRTPTPLGNPDYKICAFNNAGLIVSRLVISNSDMDSTSVKETTESIYKYFLEILTK